MRWGINLKGHEFDLQDWRDMLQPHFDPYVEVLEKDGKELFVLYSEEFQECSEVSEVRELGIPLLRRLNALAAIERKCDAVEEDGVVEKDADGKISRHHIMAVGSIRMRSRLHAAAVVIRSSTGEVIEQPPRPSLMQRGLRNETANLQDALEHFSRADNWHDLYKAFEAIKHICGRQDDIPIRCNVPKDEVTEFNLNCQNVRHHNFPHKPREKWTFKQGRSFVRRLFQELLKEPGGAC